MKLIKAIIKSERLDAVKSALEKNEFFGMTINEVQGRGDQKGLTLQYRGGSLEVDFIQKTEINIISMDEDTETIINIIREAACTGKIGDGRIFILPVEKSIRIRTGEEVSE